MHSFKYISFFLLLLFLVSCQLFFRVQNLNNTALPVFKNSVSMELLEIPKGDFQMGCSDSDPSCDEDELPARKIKIDAPFYFGKYEITKGEFSRFISETNYQTDAQTLGFANTWRNCQGMKQKENHPVICVSWNDAKAFTVWLSQKEGKKYRLPTEAEWEYAARGSNAFARTTNLVNSRYHWGMNMDESFAWYNKNSKKSTQAVGTRKPNFWGLYDLAGNVWEWCEDDYDPNYFKKKDEQNFFRKDGNAKSLRGGSWFDSYLMLRLSARKFAPKEARENYYGFRVVMEK